MELNFYTIKWLDGKVKILDQTLLPNKVVYKEIDSVEGIAEAICSMKVRGAPLIGVAAAYGIAISAYRAKNKKDIEDGIEIISNTRITAYNLFYAINSMKNILNKTDNLVELKRLIIEEAHRIKKEDEYICQKIGEHGKKLIPDNTVCITYCNAGALATSGIGTALAPIYLAKNRIKKVYACETRPRLQGAKLTCWELSLAGIPVTLICDNMLASIMSKEKINLCIVGADRIAKNGDTANKIGTYNLAIISKNFGTPFYVAAPSTTFDPNIETGADIPIEYRSVDEIKKIENKIISADVPAINPAFDVTPREYITGFITEKGIKTTISS